jgi:NitT/TauT family transport system ATP-binding protein
MGDEVIEAPRSEEQRDAADRVQAPGTGRVEHRAGLRFTEVSHWFFQGDEARRVVDNVSLSVPDKQFVALVGPSGCGKTTLLNMIAGLIQPTRGELAVAIDGKATALPSTEVGYMWARDALLPWRSLQRNVEFGLEVRRVPAKTRRARAAQYIEMVGLAGAERKFPGQLSQGMRQRGNLARLLATDPRFILMDEPFAAVDAQTKLTLQQQFLDIRSSNPTTVVYVTHDLEEAALLSDRVVIMGRGHIAHDVTVPYGRPRVLAEFRFDPTFREFAHHLWELLRDATKETGR